MWVAPSCHLTTDHPHGPRPPSPHAPGQLLRAPCLFMCLLSAPSLPDTKSRTLLTLGPRPSCPGHALAMSVLSGLQASLSPAGSAQPVLHKPLMTELLGSGFLALTWTADSGRQADGLQVIVGVRLGVWRPGRAGGLWFGEETSLAGQV